MVNKTAAHRRGGFWYNTDMKTILLALLAAVATEVALAGLTNPAIERRVDGLLAKMTLEEKLGQLIQVGGSDEAGLPSAAQNLTGAEVGKRFREQIEKGAYGSLIGCRGLKTYNELQEAAAKSRLGIPLLVGHDMIHSAQTVYPISLALSASWDTNLWYRCAGAIAPETWLMGANWTFAPMLDIARDARWGRIAESPGQDPYLASLYGYWWTKGLQGDDLSKDYRIAACAKHFVGYGAAEGGRDYNRVEMSDSTLFNVYLPSFRGAVAAGLATVMPAFHTFNDIPCSIHRDLLTDVLRGELGFEGFTISDYDAVWEVREGRHGCGADEAEIAAKAINAGMDQEMIGGAYRRGLAAAVKDGRVTMKTVDEAVRRILRVKFALGLFERRTVDEADLRRHIDFAANRRLAREAAQKSTVLLKNAKDVLPLAKGAKLAVVGEFGDDAWEMHGSWSTYVHDNFENATLRAGLVTNGFAVAFTNCWGKGMDGKFDPEALKATIAGCDVVIGCFGETFGMNGENNSRADITLPGEQAKAIGLIRASGKPFVAVLFTGRPLAIPELAEACDALVVAWNPGGCGGWGVADVMCGAAEPTGRLTVDFPRKTGECPKYYNRTKTGRAQPDEVDGPNLTTSQFLTRYIDTPERSLFPFGYGLAYTSFAYANEKVEAKDGTFFFTADVTNTGRRVGTETVQLYIRDTVAQISRPRRELKRFEKVTLRPGETKTVRFELGPDDLGYFRGREWLVEKGRFVAWIAADSDAGKPLRFEYR